MGWQVRLTGSVRMTEAAAEELLDLRVDFREAGQRFGDYLNNPQYDADVDELIFDLGWVTWPLYWMMGLIAGTKDLPGTDELVHHGPTYDAWYETGTFFVEDGRWGYVGSGPMFDVETGSYGKLPYVGPETPRVNDVEHWNLIGPIARAVRLVDDDTYLEVETYRRGTFRCGAWDVPGDASTAQLRYGGLRIGFEQPDGKQQLVRVSDLWDRRDVPSSRDRHGNP